MLRQMICSGWGFHTVAILILITAMSLQSLVYIKYCLVTAWLIWATLQIRRKNVLGSIFFFLVAILYTTCRIDKLLFSHLKKMNSIWQQTKCIVSKIMPYFYFCFNCRVKRNKVRRSNIKFNWRGSALCHINILWCY